MTRSLQHQANTSTAWTSHVKASVACGGADGAWRPVCPVAQQVWGKPQPGGAWALLFLNAAQNASMRMSVSLSADLGLPSSAAVHVRDIWSRKDVGSLGSGADSFSPEAAVPPHDSAFFLLTPTNRSRAVPAVKQLKSDEPHASTRARDDATSNRSRAPAAQSKPPVIVQIIADDLGRWDVGWRNPSMLTPHLDSLVSQGVELLDYYTFKVCGPSRSSILSGRYPFNVGYYGNPVRAIAFSSLLVRLPHSRKRIGVRGTTGSTCLSTSR